jgi:DNA-binding response OmpR family regulator
MHPSSTRILIVDDDSTNCELVQLMLQISNPDYDVTCALTLEEGLGLAATQRFDLYILDYWLKGKSGMEVCRALRQRQPDARIMFFTGEARERERQEAMRAGADAYLIKPNNLGQLTEIANLLLHMRQSAATRSTPFTGYSDSQMDATPKSVPPAASRAGDRRAEG